MIQVDRETVINGFGGKSARKYLSNFRKVRKKTGRSDPAGQKSADNRTRTCTGGPTRT